jgi:hypothetical protein
MDGMDPCYLLHALDLHALRRRKSSVHGLEQSGKFGEKSGENFHPEDDRALRLCEDISVTHIYDEEK